MIVTLFVSFGSHTGPGSGVGSQTKCGLLLVSGDLRAV